MTLLRASTMLLLVPGLLFAPGMSRGCAETLRHPLGLEKQLQAVDAAFLATEARRRGDPRRGALVYFKSGAGCTNCHGAGDGAQPLGPDLAQIGKVEDARIIESLLHPSKQIRKGYETVSVLTADGEVLVGLIAKQDERRVVLRPIGSLTEDLVIPRDEIEQIRNNPKSVMPDGLVATLPDQRAFLDLACYLMEIAAGGPERAASLRPTPEQLSTKDDTADLDHAGIIGGLRRRDFDSGKRIYHGYCFSCHGKDGNTPSLPTARAFGTQKLKFGNDPYRMFLTLTRGNGLMAPMSHMTPKERYQVVHYVREQFMKPSNPDYFKVDKDYLRGLPAGSKDGTEIEPVERDFGPALASQLERKVCSALTLKLGRITLSYNLHTMDQAGIWQGGFLDLRETQHVKPRGEGTADPQGESIAGLEGWKWGHEGALDYPTDDLLPRGPLPAKWMDYHGYYLFGEQVALRYSVDGRELLERPCQEPIRDAVAVRHSLRVGPGKKLTLGVGKISPTATFEIADPRLVLGKSDDSGTPVCTAVGICGDTEGMQWSRDARGRIALTIPADRAERVVEIIRAAGTVPQRLQQSVLAGMRRSDIDFDAFTSGGPLLWPDQLTTVGYRGLEQGGYALDTLTLPESTPWNTWFRTSAIDFFPDGRMVLATYGGDVWIVSGIDQDLLKLRWKRFAGGLYEPFGVKVREGKIYVTCKDRLTRLHDQDGNGEADFYESFSADEDVSVNFHAFNFDLQTDLQGNFYYAKSGHGSDASIPGCIVKVSSDGKSREVFCTGFRTPNGMGCLPNGQLTVSDNQGQWTPASKVSLLKRGGFYGWVNNYSIPGKWAPGGGTINLKEVVPPSTFDPPLVWMPQEFDNSSGGQLWVDDPRWGPLAGRLLHTSFGKGWMYYMMMQQVDDTHQAAIIKLPFDFRTGVMRARVNPADGQVYATGLQGWNGTGRAGLREKGVQRLRYTGRPHRMVSDCSVEKNGLRLQFNFPLDAEAATSTSRYQVRHWNYRWRQEYGSDQYSPLTGEPGVEPLEIEAASLSPDGRTVLLEVPRLKPVNQVHILLRLKSESGARRSRKKSTGRSIAFPNSSPSFLFLTSTPLSTQARHDVGPLSIAAFDRAKALMPGGVNSPARAFGAVGGTPLFIASASGPYLTDVDGRKLLDYIGSWGPMILGHAHPAVVEAITAAAQRGSSYGAPTEAESVLAEQIIDAVPSVEKVRLVNSGTEATMSAIRAARGVTGRAKIIKFAGNYHGHVDSLLVAAGSSAATLGVPDSPGVTPGTGQDTMVLEYNDCASLREAFSRFDREIAAVILEPVVGNMGCVPPTMEFLKTARELTSSQDSILIFDEVMTGFRLALGGAQERFGVIPDMTTLGKVVGGGMPLGAYGGRTDIMDQILPAGKVFQAGTLSGNPVAVAAGSVTLRLLKQDPPYAYLEALGQRLAAGLGRAATDAGIAHQVQCVGSMMTLFFNDQPVSQWTGQADRCDRDLFGRYFWGLIRERIYMPCSQFEALFLGRAHTESMIDETIDAAAKVLREI